MMARVMLFGLLVVCQVAALLAPLRALWAIAINPNQALEIVKGYDLLGNTVLNGVAGEYISTRAYLAAKEGRRWAIALSGLLDSIDPDHCQKSYEAELARVAALKVEWVEDAAGVKSSKNTPI